MVNVLVTGAAGFLGRQVVDRLMKDPRVDDVFPIDNWEPNCGAQVGYLAAHVDVADHYSLNERIIAGDITHIIHLAAYGRNLSCQFFPQRAWQVNVGGTINVLEAARNYGLRRVVHCSSNIVLCPDMTTYKATKVAGELAVEAYQRYGLSVQALRPSNIAGPGQSKTEYQLCAFAGLDESYRTKGYVEITGDGSQTRDFVDVRDVARAFHIALFSDYVGPTIDIATGVRHSIKNIVEYLKLPIRYVEKRAGDAQTITSDIWPARMELGFRAEIDMYKTIEHSFPSVKLS